MRTDVTKVRFVNPDELKLLWRVLERLQADVTPHGRGCGYVWDPPEVDALVKVMDAVKDTYSLIEEDERSGLSKMLREEPTD